MVSSRYTAGIIGNALQSRQGGHDGKTQKDKLLSREKKLTFRLSDAEYDLILSNADNAKLSLSEYIRKLLLNGKVNVSYNIAVDLPEIQELTMQLSAIGNNLNQIARYYNTGGLHSRAMQDELHRCFSELNEMRKEIVRLGGSYGNLKAHRSKKR